MFQLCVYTPLLFYLCSQGPTAVERFLLPGGPCSGPRGVDFDPDPKESCGLALCLEGSHSRRRIIHWRDQTGQAIMASLIEAVRAHPMISLRKGCTAVDFLLEDRPADPHCVDVDESNARRSQVGFGQGVVQEEDEMKEMETGASSKRCVGALVLQSNELLKVRAAATILATGGCGELWEHTSNPAAARGDGIAMALRAGCALSSLHYMQFHPTTLYVPGERRFLLTEALRGEGATLLDPVHQQPFAKQYHPSAELAPRDVVSRMILSEMAKAGTDHVWLDVRHMGQTKLEHRFPGIVAHCRSKGMNPVTDLLPVVPAAHYHCGGVLVDLDGATSVPGLYAAGEVSCTGLHGANRLASTSLLEGLVWGRAAADAAFAEKASFTSAAAASSGSATADSAMASDDHSREVAPGGGVALGSGGVGGGCPIPGAPPVPHSSHENSSKACDHAAQPPPLEALAEDSLGASGEVGREALLAAWYELKHTMWTDVGIVRRPSRLAAAAVSLAALAVRAETAFQRCAQRAAAATSRVKSEGKKNSRRRGKGKGKGKGKKGSNGRPKSSGAVDAAAAAAAVKATREMKAALALRNASAAAAAVAAAASNASGKSVGTHYVEADVPEVTAE